MSLCPMKSCPNGPLCAWLSSGQVNGIVQCPQVLPNVLLLVSPAMSTASNCNLRPIKQILTLPKTVVLENFKVNKI